LNGQFSFPKSERIVSQKLIDELFSKSGSHSLVAFPVRAVYKPLSPSTLHLPPSTLLVSVPKKHFKHAVDRNRVKRQLREAYRHHKHLLDGKQLAVAFIWLCDAHFPSTEVDRRIKSLLTRIAEKA
jgi:ribonuclease P protein component